MSQTTTTDLQISVEEIAAWGRKLVITVPAGRVRAERSKVARQVSQRVRLPGFRKGKVPPARVEARFGTDIDRQTQQRLIDAAFREAVRSQSLEPISEPRVAKVSYAPDAEMTFEVAFDIRPEIKLARLGGFRLSRPPASVSDAEVDEQLEELQRQQALWRPVERRPQAGDSVEVLITPRDETTPETQSRSYRFVIGEGQAIPDVEAAIMTLDPQSSGEFSVAFPDDFQDEAQRGQSQALSIELKQVLERELPTLDDEFARSVGEFSSIADLRQAVADDLHRYKDQQIELRLAHQIIDQIIEANPFEVPESMVARYVDAMIGTPQEDADPEVVARAREEARPAALWGIKRTLILQEVARDQGIEASREEVQERLQRLAKRAGRSLSEVRARLAKSGELRDIERRIVEEKVFALLREQSEIETSGA